MAAAIGQVRVATPTGSSSNPSTPPYPHFPRLPHTSSATPSIQRNASTSSSHSTTTNSSTSSLAAVPMRPPPSETRTAATSSSQTGTSVTSGYTSEGSSYGGRGYMWNGPRSEMSRHGTLPIPSIHTSAPPHSPLASPSSPLQERSTTLPITRPSPTTPRAPSAPWSADLQSPDTAPRVTITASGPSSPASPRGRGVGSIPLSPSPGQPRTLSVGVKPERDLERERRMSQASNASSSGSKKPSARDWVFGEEIGRGSYSTVRRILLTGAGLTNRS
jgi:3-phosphoinositide dependent protein kinase-1